MLEAVFQRVLRAVFGGGADISAANPLPVTNDELVLAFKGMPAIDWQAGLLFDLGQTAFDTTSTACWPSVVFFDGMFRLYFGGRAGGIAYPLYAESVDGVTWTNFQRITVGGVAQNGWWPRWAHVVNGEVWIYRTGTTGTRLYSSTDGIDFTDEGLVVALDGWLDRLQNYIVPYEHEGVSVVQYNGLFYMMYSVLPDDDLGRNWEAFFLATSPDGKTYTRLGRVLERSGKHNEFDLRRPNLIPPGVIDDRWWLLYQYTMMNEYPDSDHYSIAFANGYSPTQWIRRGKFDFPGGGALISDQTVDSVDTPFFYNDGARFRVYAETNIDRGLYYGTLEKSTMENCVPEDNRDCKGEWYTIWNTEVGVAEVECPNNRGVWTNELDKKQIFVRNTQDVDVTVDVDVGLYGQWEEIDSLIIPAGEIRSLALNDHALRTKLRISAAGAPGSGVVFAFLAGRRS